MAAAVSGLSPVIMTVRMPILRKLREALLDAAFDDVLEYDHAEHCAAFRDDERRAARDARCHSTVVATSAREQRHLRLHPCAHRLGRAFAMDVAAAPSHSPRRSCASAR